MYNEESDGNFLPITLAVISQLGLKPNEAKTT